MIWFRNDRVRSTELFEQEKKKHSIRKSLSCQRCVKYEFLKFYKILVDIIFMPLCVKFTANLLFLLIDLNFNLDLKLTCSSVISLFLSLFVFSYIHLTEFFREILRCSADFPMSMNSNAFVPYFTASGSYRSMLIYFWHREIVWVITEAKKKKKKF